MKTLRVLVLLFSICCSAGWLLRCWNDRTLDAWHDRGRSEMREQTREDHAAGVLFAIARVVLTMGFMQFVVVVTGLESKENKR